MASMKRAEAEAALRAAQARLEELDALADVFGPEPEFGSIVRMWRDINGRRYHYAITSGNNRAGETVWYASGNRSGTAQSGVSWDALCEWMVEFNLDHFEIIGPPARLNRVASGRSRRRTLRSASHQPQDIGPDGISWTPGDQTFSSADGYYDPTA